MGVSKLIKIAFFPLKIIKWASSWLACSIFVALLISTPVEGLSEAERSAISQNCPTIKQTLEQLQKVDSRTRTYLGTTYETIANKFITPLNLRLVNNYRPTLSNIQSDFMNAQNQFRDAYTEYMRELEGLIATDCQGDPEGFYQRLIATREKRAKLRSRAEDMSKLANEQYKAAMKLKESL